MTFIITGGGTGGHLAIAKSLRDAAVGAGHRCIFIGSTSGQDQAWFAKESERSDAIAFKDEKSSFAKESTAFDAVHFLQTSGVVNKKGLAKLSSLFAVLKATFTALALVKQADAVMSVGGFSAAPASFAAVLLRKPYFIHEQNAAIGRLNRLLRPFTKAFFSSYENASPVKDYPVRGSFFEYAYTREKIKTIIFLGGSQGARFINELALKIAPLLREKNIEIIHQAGKLEKEKVEEAYKALGIKAEVFDFRPDVDKLMQKSDFAVSRSGASTLWELCASRLPALYIPYPFAAGDHQFYNASYLVEQKASWICRQEDDPYDLLVTLLDKSMKEQSEVLQSLIHKDGALSIIKEIEKCLQN
jgi:UDP-N-acetylglucosamine--N-acetylmuramyl-(pentapeptide) pyrophosphoryl-undecaprenol N-acetylglucosamine transferase